MHLPHPYVNGKISQALVSFKKYMPPPLPYFLYFFIISSLFPYFNLSVSIFIQSHVNNNLHVSTLFNIHTILHVSTLYYRYLFVSIFIQSHVNNNLHVSTLYYRYYQNLMLTTICMFRPYIILLDTISIYNIGSKHVNCC